MARKESETLNGENLVPGDQTNMLFSGTIVAQGRAKAVVVQTGASTEIGKIASSVKQIGITRLKFTYRMLVISDIFNLRNAENHVQFVRSCN